MTKKNLLIALIFILLSFLWFFLPSISCEAAEAKKEVVIPIEQLTNLEVELQRASKAIKNSKTNSAMLREQLNSLQIALTEAKQQSEKLRGQLATLKVTLKQQQTQLQNANESLEILNKEMKKERKNLERQRNIAYLVTAVFLCAAVNK